MRVITKLYFNAFPIALTLLMFLLYDGNVFFFNLYLLILMLILIVNGLVLRNESISDTPFIEKQEVRIMKRYHIFNFVFYIASVIGIYFYWIINEVLPGFGSV